MVKGDKKMEQEREKRNIKLTVRLSQSEYEKIQKKCDGQMAVWLRDLALDQHDRRQLKYPPVDPDLLRHLSRIGNNINQIAKAVNTDQQRIELIGIMSQLERIADELRQLRHHYTGIGDDS